MCHHVIFNVSKIRLKVTQEIETQHTRRGIVLYETNPFMPGVKTRTRRVANKRGNMMLVSSDTAKCKRRWLVFGKRNRWTLPSS